MSGSAPTAPVIDAHHHLWTYTADEFDWIDAGMSLLRRDFDAADLSAALDAGGVDLSVAVQARQSLDETRMLLDVARRNPRIAGVVGWLPLAERVALEAALQEFAGSSRLVGARHVVQAEAEGFLDGEAFLAGIALLEPAGLAYDLLLLSGQLSEAQRFVDRWPRQRFVLDHVSKPRIAEGALEPWATDLRELARRPHVSCKLSGMATEANWQSWSLATLRPYLDVAVEAFGPARLMAGSDWPVCLVASSYQQWWQTLRIYFADFSAAEQQAVFGGNAAAFYRLQFASSDR